MCSISQFGGKSRILRVRMNIRQKNKREKKTQFKQIILSLQLIIYIINATFKYV
jgi:hypothetical protein